ncbi:hypothetical protein [Salegentibacter sediminis]|uniref:hypothetical protein n=1 Tax=Salegentibacter sediminis TaxID=1930251 RepID=UPI0009BC97D2|nr:hypothetical protein [Salegentibacter sediminis]
MKRILTGVIVFLLLACQPKTQKKDLIAWLPQDSEVVVQTHDLESLSSNLASLDFVSKNDFKLKQEIQDRFIFLNYIDSLGSSLIAFSDLATEHYTFTLISENQPVLKLDSVPNKSVERLKFKDFEIDKVKLEEHLFFTSRVDGIFLAGNSLDKLKILLEGKGFLNDSEFKKVFKATDPKETSIVIRHEQVGEKFKEWFPATDSTLTTFASWSSVDLNNKNGSLNFNGLSLWPEKPGLQHIFKDVGASPNQISRVVPVTAPGFSSFGYDNFDQFQQNFSTYFQKEFSEVEIEILKNVSEIGQLNYPSENLLILNNIDVILAEQNLARFSGESKEYRSAKIYQFDNPELFAEHLNPLISPVDLNFYTILENFVIFSNSEEKLQNVISAFVNKNTLAQQEHFQKAFEHLAKASNILLVANNELIKDLVKKRSSEEFGNKFSSLNFDKNKLSTIQLVADRNFSHIHGIFHKSEDKLVKKDTEQLLSIKLDEEILGEPVFFSNHNNNQKDIAVQDINNVLYLISNKGDIYWKKQLDGPILGGIKEVDILKNGKFQLAFATPNRLEVIARNANSVKPFPLKFKDNITQPLALFDYDNNRNYRFLITQNRELHMYDSKGRSVGGFKFKSTASEVLFPPRHIRMGNKDYIVIAEESGKLNILSRQGRQRVKVSENFNFSDNEWFQYDRNFISSNDPGELILVDENGKVSKQNLNLAQNHKIDATSNLLVSFSENTLKIRDKEVTLDFGLYTEPQIFLEDNKYYISITDLQTQKVYVFDSNAELLSGFPVYGTSTIDLSNINNDNAPEFVVKGDKGELIIYKF